MSGERDNNYRYLLVFYSMPKTGNMKEYFHCVLLLRIWFLLTIQEGGKVAVKSGIDDGMKNCLVFQEQQCFSYKTEVQM